MSNTNGFNGEMNLNSSNLKIIPSNVFEMTKLKTLYLNENRIKTLSRIGNLNQLIKLTMTKNKIKFLPNEIKKLKNLTFLDLSKNKLKIFPTQVFGLKNLKNLILSKNSITKLPKEIHKLYFLKYLDLSFNRIQEIPVELNQLENLKNLFLESNLISKFPSKLILNFLETLNISDNPIINIPSDFFQFKNLIRLESSLTSMVDVHPNILKLKYLVYLNLLGNKIKEIPVEIENLSKLQILNFSSNFISFLPKELFELNELRELDLSMNKIKITPRSIKKLGNLEVLKLRYNEIEMLPKETFHLKKLIHLSISNENFSFEFGECLKLYAKEIKDNPFEFIYTFTTRRIDERIDLLHLFEDFIKDPSNFKELDRYSYHFEVLLDYWKSGSYYSNLLDTIILRNRNQIKIFDPDVYKMREEFECLRSQRPEVFIEESIEEWNCEHRMKDYIESNYLKLIKIEDSFGNLSLDNCIRNISVELKKKNISISTLKYLCDMKFEFDQKEIVPVQ